MHYVLDLIIAEQEFQRYTIAIFHIDASEIISSTYVKLFLLARQLLVGTREEWLTYRKLNIKSL